MSSDSKPSEVRQDSMCSNSLRASSTLPTMCNASISQKVHTVQSHIVESNHGVLHYMLITNTQFWNGLPYAIRVELDGIVEEVTQVVNAEAEALNARDRARIVASGKTKLITLSAEQRAAWREAMLPVWKLYEDEIGADVIRAALAVNRNR